MTTPRELCDPDENEEAVITQAIQALPILRDFIFYRFDLQQDILRRLDALADPNCPETERANHRVSLVFAFRHAIEGGRRAKNQRQPSAS